MDDGDDLPIRTVEKLEVESEEERQERIQTTLEKLNSSSSAIPSTQPSFSFEFGNRQMQDIAPPTELLSRVQAFLPELEASNNLLSQRFHVDPKSVDIEHVDEGMDQYIEMNLGLGVFESRSGSNGQQDEDAEMSSSSTSGTSESEEESDIDTDSSSEIITSFNPVRPIKPLPRRRTYRTQPQIVVLGEES